MIAERRADYVADMVDAVQAALSYVQGMDEASFRADRRTQQAVLHNVMVLGEAATQLAKAVPDLVERCPDDPGPACVACATGSRTATSMSIWASCGPRSSETSRNC